MPAPTSPIVYMPNEIGTGGAALNGIEALSAAIRKLGADARLKAEADAAKAAGTPGASVYTPAALVQPNSFEPAPAMTVDPAKAEQERQMVALVQALTAGGNRTA